MKHRSRFFSFTQTGFSLIEMMVALTIGLFLLGGVLAIYVNSKQSYRQNDAMGRLQENARFAFQMLSRELQGAGFPGCSGSDGTIAVTNNLNPYGKDGTTTDKVASFAWDFRRSAVEGFEATSASAWSSITDGTPSVSLSGADVAPGVIGGTDVIVVRSPDSISVRIKGQPNGNEVGATCLDAVSGLPTANLKVEPEPDATSPRLAVGDTVAALTCGTKTLFLITGYDGTSGVINHSAGAAGSSALRNTTANLGGCLVTGDLTKMSAKSFFVRANPAGVRALYRATAGVDAGGNPKLNPVELTEGVQDMQITYGQDTDGDFLADSFVKADAVSDWSKVVSVQVSLLMRSVEDNVVTAPLTYTFDGSQTTATDRRLYQVFTSTIALRSRIL
jgi:type IV pilus assembly protein PilW